MEFLERTFLDNTVLQWAIALAIAAGVVILARILRGVVLKRVRRMTEKTENKVDDLVIDLLENLKGVIVLALGIYAGSLSLTFSENIRGVLESGAAIVLLIQGALWGNQIIAFVLTNYIKQHDGDEASWVTAHNIINFLSRLVLWSLVALLILDNLGMEINSLIASLGIGGIAIALAVQNILGDLFGSLTIILDQPFQVGDYVEVGSYGGTVDSIGLKTTRMISLSGEELVFANSDLLNSRIRNYKKMEERRIVFTIGATYETPYEKLEMIPGIVEEIVSSQENVRFDRAHFKSMGDFALNFEVVYHMLDPTYALYMDTQQVINYALLRRFADEGIGLAYPTQTIFLEQPPES